MPTLILPKGASPARQPSSVRLQIVTPSPAPPDGEGWLHEIKHDGHRLVAMIDDSGRLRLISRNGHDRTEAFAAPFGRLATAGHELVIDGEIAVPDDAGVTHLDFLNDVIARREPHRLAYYAFDLLHIDGDNIRRCSAGIRASIRDGVILSLDKRGLWACDSNEVIAMFVAMVRNSARMPSKRAALEWLFRLLTWVCIALLTVLSLTPGDYMVRTAAPGDLEHFVAYLGTGVIAFLGYERRVGALVLGLVLCGYAGLLEIGQNWSPGRHPDLIDFASSAGGVITGMVLIGLWNAIRTYGDRSLGGRS